ncbi:hypothetical protein DPMN_128799 [Dreissena polymorpha]|uniref:Uncharacterized protein n=1 Tax=Dreissena polymorpha TaxID=45954 RepID=A0A9D4H1X5_DREPO|nr:hypothetical protein DPMN_128799 [Dreissena polymorpha]
MLSSPSVPSQTGLYPLIGTVALADTLKSQPSTDYRPRAGLRKPPMRRGPLAAHACSARRVCQGVRGSRPRKTVPWVPSETDRLGPRYHPYHKLVPAAAAVRPDFRPRELGSPARATRPARPPLQGMLILQSFIYVFQID